MKETKTASEKEAKNDSKKAVKTTSKAATKATSKAAAKTTSKAAAKETSKAAVKTTSEKAGKPAPKTTEKTKSSAASKSSEPAVPFQKSAGNPDTKTPRRMISEMPVVKRVLRPVPLSELPPFPISKKPDNRVNFKAIWDILQQLYPKPEVELNFETPFEILTATILSAQCTDRQVNTVTRFLFKKYKTIEDYAYADPAEFGKDIYSTGFYNSKTKHVIGCANAILKDFGGTVPSTMKELTKLPGVGRKTANIVLSRGFGINDGIAVDTHVKRLSGKIGLTEQEDPEKIEQDLMKLAKREDYDNLSLTLIFHGRRVCDAKKPRCDVCAISDMCPSAFI